MCKDGPIPLSEDISCCRAERPDEWTMDRFIRKAEELEAQLAHKDKVIKIMADHHVVASYCDSCSVMCKPSDSADLCDSRFKDWAERKARKLQ